MTTIIIAAVITLVLVVCATYALRAGAQSPSKVNQVARLGGPGEFDLEVVGESFYQENLREVVRGHGESGYVRLGVEARLVQEDDNPHDPKAVGVYIDGWKVGHLDRATARSYRRQMQDSGAAGLDGLCGALICGGGAGKPSYGVFLDLPVA